MKAKARATCDDAQFLFGCGRYNAAAGRAYYAIFQAVTAEFDRMRKRPGDFRVLSNDNPGKWPHCTVRDNASAAGIASRNTFLVRQAWALRVKADYEPAPVLKDELSPIMVKLEELIEETGA